ncbi:hypothetical protein GCM10011348_29180 [Marinobacterium nitratireducens]|uniref:ISKra4 family transposase n=1 Tax=Marinobacterium nitratireducens TaxID=518897 RepID=A0A918DVW2_9GAMM|nr:ISKra4 family transposase [Marinobacterium nitratireducens]GGO83985.1 hypothetical protein GCM10011348_29180 [Marinobacterium nitratireducens]
MKFKVQLISVIGGHEEARDLVCLEREALDLATLGLTLAEGKGLLKAIQEALVEKQTTAYLDTQCHCPVCGKARPRKGGHHITVRTLFGKLTLDSPRLFHCDCQPHPTKTFSPLAQRLPERISPERLFLETKWGSLASYGLTVDLLKEVLPLDEQLNAITLRNHLLQVAERMEQALGEEQGCFIEGCQLDWDRLPLPDGPLTVGLDGGFVRAQHKQGHFEVITGKSVLAFERDAKEDAPSAKRFGFVQTFDTKPRRRLFEVLKSQGMQANQQVIFLSDGGEDVRGLPFYLNPQAEHLLDWFHVTMRITTMTQTAKGLPATLGEGAEAFELRDEVLDALESIKWYLWHGHVFRALQEIQSVEMDLEAATFESQTDAARKLLKMVEAFHTYIQNNRPFIPNYGERFRQGETISTAFVESTVNQVVSKRMVKKQQMQWSERGAHLLLQVRTRVLDDDLEDVFRDWYPGFRPPDSRQSPPQEIRPPAF